MRVGAARPGRSRSRSRATAAATAAAAAAAAARPAATASTSVAASAAATSTAAASAAAATAAVTVAGVAASGAAAMLAAGLCGCHRFRCPVLARERAPRAEACGATTGALGSASMLAAAAVQRSGPSTGPSVPLLLARVCAPHDTSTPLGFHSGRRRVCAALAGVFLMAYLCVYCLTCSGAVSLWQRTGSQGNASRSQQEIGSFRFACPARPFPCLFLFVVCSEPYSVLA